MWRVSIGVSLVKYDPKCILVLGLFTDSRMQVHRDTEKRTKIGTPIGLSFVPFVSRLFGCVGVVVLHAVGKK